MKNKELEKITKILGGDEVKIQCKECEWKGTDAEQLKTQNPFSDQHFDFIYGCPNCKEINCLIYLCDEPGCGLEITCGTTTKCWSCWSSLSLPEKSL